MSTAWVRGNTPEIEGWYRVMHPGDSESIDGHTIYEYGDYPGWAYWSAAVEPTPVQPGIIMLSELTQVPQEAHWVCEHDEDGESIFAFYGPIEIPEFTP